MIRNFEERKVTLTNLGMPTRAKEAIGYYAGYGKSEWVLADADVNARSLKEAVKQMLRKCNLFGGDKGLDEETLECFLNDEYRFLCEPEEGRYVEEQDVSYKYYIALRFPSCWR